MARSYGAIKVSIWQDEDWRRLSKEAQRAYLVLISQPQMNNCGVLPFTPGRWARYAADENEAAFRVALGELEQARYVVTDEPAAELLIRTFIRHDAIEKQPNLVTAARREYEAVESKAIRDELLTAYPNLFDKTFQEGVPEGVPTNGVAEGVEEGVPTRGGRAAPHPSLNPHQNPPPSEEGVRNPTNARDDDLLTALIDTFNPTTTQRARWIHAATTNRTLFDRQTRAALENGRNPTALLDDLIQRNVDPAGSTSAHTTTYDLADPTPEEIEAARAWAANHGYVMPEAEAELRATAAARQTADDDDIPF